MNTMSVQSDLEKEQKELDSLLTAIIKNQKRNYKVLARLFVVVVICLTVIICTLIYCFTWYESQFEWTETTTKEITQEVSGENSSINNVEGKQYNDNATHNEGN